MTLTFGAVVGRIKDIIIRGGEVGFWLFHIVRDD